MLAFHSKVKYIKIQKHDRIFASRISDHQLIDVTPASEDIISDGKRVKPKYHYEHSGPDSVSAT